MNQTLQQNPLLKNKFLLSVIIGGIIILAEAGGLIAQSIQKNNTQNELTKISEDLDDLQENYDELHESFTTTYENYQLESALRIDNLLASFYDELRSAIGPTGGAWALTEQQYWDDAAEFATNLGMHDQGRVYWSTLDATYRSIKGEHTCETAERILEDIMGFIDLSNSDSTLDKMNKILTFINNIIEYQHDINDVFHSPLETLTFKSGDCDDFTILACAMFEEIGIESAVGLFTNTADDGHAMTLVRLDTLNPYGGSYYYPDLTHLGLESGSWIIVEPQTTLDDQYTSWVSQWSLLTASELDFHG